MVTFSSAKFFYLAKYCVDFRKGHDGLLSEAYNLDLNPFSGDLLIFIAKDRRKLKIIYADSNGLWVAYKKFSSGSMKTLLTMLQEPSVLAIALSELSLIIEGARYIRGDSAPNWPEQ